MLFKYFNDQVKLKANNYLHSVLSLVKTGPDRADLAYTLWTRCALPQYFMAGKLFLYTRKPLMNLYYARAYLQIHSPNPLELY